MKNPRMKAEKIRYLPVSRILSGSVLPRRLEEDAELESLAHSISRYGMLQPILVQSARRGYRLLCGRRRLRAARLLGLETVPCRVLELSPREAGELVFAENLHRKELSSLESAKAAQQLQRSFPYRLGELALRIGEDPSRLCAKERLMHFAPEEQSLFSQFGLDPAYAEPILHLREPQLRRFAIRHVSTHGYSVEEATKLCLSLALHPEEFAPPIHPPTPQKRPVRRFVVKDVRFFVNSVDRAIGSIRSAGIDVEAVKCEEEGCITYSIRIPV